MKNIESRLNIIIGQLEGLKKMIQSPDKDCVKIITQVKAAKSALSSLTEKFLEMEFDHCLSRAGQKEKDQLRQIFSEVIKK